MIGMSILLHEEAALLFAQPWPGLKQPPSRLIKYAPYRFKSRIALMDFKPSRILADLGGFVLLAAIGLWGTDYGRHGQFIQPPGAAYLEAVDTIIAPKVSGRITGILATTTGRSAPTRRWPAPTTETMSQPWPRPRPMSALPRTTSAASTP